MTNSTTLNIEWPPSPITITPGSAYELRTLNWPGSHKQNFYQHRKKRTDNYIFGAERVEKFIMEDDFNL